MFISVILLQVDDVSRSLYMLDGKRPSEIECAEKNTDDYQKLINDLFADVFLLLFII